MTSKALLVTKAKRTVEKQREKEIHRQDIPLKRKPKKKILINL